MAIADLTQARLWRELNKIMSGFVECDQVAVDRADWVAARSGDVAAKAKLSAAVKGLHLSSHVLSFSEDEVLVTLRELDEAGVISGVIVCS